MTHTVDVYGTERETGIDINDLEWDYLVRRFPTKNPLSTVEVEAHLQAYIASQEEASDDSSSDEETDSSSSDTSGDSSDTGTTEDDSDSSD